MVCLIVNPSILSADFADLACDCQRILDAGDGDVKWLHIDIMDGHFVPNISFGPPVLSCLTKKLADRNLFYDCHMMVSNPLQWVEPMAQAGGSQYTFHLEAAENPQAVIDKVREHGMKVGIAIKPGTPVEEVMPYADQADMILVMTVEPGFGGQKFMPEMMPKVRTLRHKYPELNLEVDGGLGENNVDVAAEAGANVIVAGTLVFKSPDVGKTVKVLNQSVQKHLAK